MSPSELTEAFFGGSENMEITQETSFDSYMIGDDDLYARKNLSHLRLLTVDNHLIVPTEINTRVTVTAADVLHS